MPKTLVAAIFVLPLLLTGHLLAQTAAPVGPPPDPQFVQNAIAVLQQQRNKALDEAAQAQAQAAVSASQLAAAQKEIEKLKADAAKTAPPAEPKKD